MNDLTPEQHAELNAWICENVMGLVSVGKDAEMQERWLPKEIHAVINCISYSELSRHYLYAIPRYTTSPADAMAVLEKICERVTITIDHVYCDGHNWSICAFGSIDEAIYEETLPLAICLFARQLFTEEKR